MSNLATLQISLSKFPKQSEKRLSRLSFNEEIFNESAPFYEDKLHQSGYQQKLKYNPVNKKTHSKRNHKRNKSGLTPLPREMYPQKSANIF